MKILTLLFSFSLAASLYAQTEIQEFKGQSISNNECSLKIERDGDVLKSVELKGATKDFEIMSESGFFRKSINEYGGSDLMNFDSPDFYSLFKFEKSLFGHKEVFTFNSKDLKKKDDSDNNEDELKYFSMKFKMEISYNSHHEISRVEVKSKAKAVGIPLASREFICE